MQLVKEYLYEDIYYINVLNESILNEKLDIEKLKNVLSKITNKDLIFDKLINKFNITKNFNIKKNIGAILLVIFLGNFISKNSVFSETNIDGLSSKVAKETTIDVNKLKDIVEEDKTININVKNINYKTAKASKEAKDLIKDHEKLRLEAYAIGDGKITVGYGHAYPENKSPYNVGDKISKEKAESLFNEDIHIIEEGIKRIFLQWEKQGINVHLTQSMFDAMVSMGFNMGVSGLRNTEFIQHLKNNNIKQAAEKIKTTRIGSVVKDKEGNKKYVPMPGLITRRHQEHALFTQDL